MDSDLKIRVVDAGLVDICGRGCQARFKQVDSQWVFQCDVKGDLKMALGLSYRGVVERLLAGVQANGWGGTREAGKGKRIGRPKGSGAGRTAISKSVSMSETDWLRLDRLRGEKSRGAALRDLIIAAERGSLN